MSTSIEQRVVQMRFDNKQFEKNAAQSMSTLDKFKEKLNFKNAAQGLEDVSRAAAKVSFQPMGDGVDKVSLKFDALAVVAITALTKITNAALNAGKNITKSLTIEPVMTGFNEYETKLNSIQTIMSNTASKGTTMADVTKILDELNAYADKTIYNFAEMTRNIGTFTAAGVELETSAKAIQGIANLAAASGSNSQQASIAMYQLSQALASGTIRLMDWNSVVNAGMGGEKFQNALKETAREYGVAVDSIIEKEGSFRESLSTGWLSAEIMTKTLNKFTVKGAKEYAKAMMEAGKYTQEQADALIKEAQAMEDAATKVKTFTQLLSTLKEAAQSGWAKSWEIIIGDFEESKQLFTSISDAIGGLIDGASEARNTMLQGWKDLGGRTAIVKTIAKAFEILSSVVTNLKSAFEDIFPPITAQNLFDATLAVKEFVYSLKPSEATLNTIRVLFKALLIPVQVFVQTVRVGITVIAGLIKIAFTLADSLIALPSLIGSVNDPLKKLFGDDRYSRIVKAFTKIINGLGESFSKIGVKIGEIIRSLTGMAQSTGIGIFQNLLAVLKPIGDYLLDRIVDGFELLSSINFSSFGDAVVGAFNDIEKGFTKFIDILKSGKDAIFTFIKQFVFTDTINSVKNLSNYIQWLVDSVRNFAINFNFDAVLGSAGDSMSSFKDIIKQVMEAVVDFTNKLSPSKILIFAFGVALISLVFNISRAVSTLSKVIAAAKTTFSILNTALNNIVTKVKTSKILQVAIALEILIISLIQLGKVDINGLKQATISMLALVGAVTLMAGAMALINKFLVSTPEIAKNLQTFSVAMLAMSGSIAIISASLFVLSKIDMKGMGVKLLALVGAIVVMVTAVNAIEKKAADALGSAAIILALAGAMSLVAFTFSRISKQDIDISISTLGSILIVVAALKLLAKTSGDIKFSAGAGLFLLVMSLGLFAKQLEKLSKYDTADMLIGLINFLPIFIILKKIAKTVGKSKNIAKLGTQILAISVSLLILHKAIEKFNEMSISEIAKGGLAVSALILVFGLMMRLAGSGDKTIKMTSSFIAISVAIGILSFSIKQLGDLSIKQVYQGTTVVSILIVLMTYLAKAMGTAQKSTGAVIAIIACLGLLMSGIALLSLIDDAKGLASAVAALSITMLSLGGMLKMIGGFKIGSAFASVILLTAFIFEVTHALKALNEMTPEKALSNAGALSAIMLTFAGITRIFKTIEGDRGSLLKTGGILLALVFACGGILVLLTNLPINEGILEKVASLSLLLLALSGAAAIMGKFNVGVKKSASAGGGLAIFVGILTIVLGAIGAITSIKVGEDQQPLSVFLESGINVINSLYKIVPAIAVIGAIAGVFSKFKIDIASAWNASAGIAIFMVILTAVVTAIGAAFTKWPKLEPMLDKAIAIFPKVGQAIGGLISGFGAGLIGGAVTVILDSLGALGKGLSDFMDSIGPFFEGLDQIDAAKVSAVASLGTMILSITSANILQAITAFAGDPLTKFADQLIEFGPKFAEFADTIKSIDESKVTAFSAALGAFASVISAIPPDIEVGFGLFSSKTDWSGFGSGMKSFADGFNQFAQTIDSSVLSKEMVERTSYAMQALTDMANNIPRSGGALQGFFGEKDMSVFGTQLKTFGEDLMSFFNTINNSSAGADAVKLDSGLVTKAANASKALADFAQDVPRSGGALEGFFGKKDMSVFGLQLQIFGMYLVNFFKTISADDVKMSRKLVNDAGYAGEAFANLAKKLPETGGHWQTFFGSVNLGTFGTEIGEFGAGIASFFKSFKDTEISEADVDLAEVAGEVFANLTKSLDPNEGTPFWESSVNLATYGDDLEKLGSGMAKFYEHISGIAFDQVDRAIAAIKEIAGAGDTFKNLSSGSSDKFSKYLSSLADVTLTDFADKFDEGVDELENAVISTLSKALEQASTTLDQNGFNFSGIVDAIINAINAGQVRFDAIGHLITYWVRDGVQSNYEVVKAIGTYLVDALIDGLTDKVKNEELVAAVEGVCGDILKMMYEHLTIANKTSGKFKSIGEYCIDGFIKGFKEKADISMPEIKAVGNSIVTATEEATGVNSPSVKFAEIGKYCMMGLSEGLKEYSGESIKTAVKMGADLIQAMKDFLKIKSPSEVTRDEIGRYIVKGIAEGISSDTSAEEAATQKAQNIVSAFQKEFDKLDQIWNTKSLEFDLWQSMNPGAGLGETNAVQAELLDNQLKIQAERVNTANAQYKATLHSLGESSTETMEAYNAYLQEKISLADMADQLAQLQYNNRQAFGEFAQIYADNIDALERFGFSTEEIRDLSKSESGWVESGAMDKTGSIEDIMNQYLAETSAGSSEVEVVITQSVQKAVTKSKETAAQGGKDTWQAFVDGAKEKADEVLPDWANVVEDGFPSREDMMEVGKNLGLGTYEGMLGSFNKWIIGTGGAASEVSKGTLDAINKECGINSPSIYTQETGVNLILGLRNGILDPIANAQVTEAMTSTSNNTLSIFDNVPSQYMTIGTMMMDGLANGVASGSSKVINAVVDVTRRAMAQAKAALGIRSPSREFYRIGKMIDQGLSNGIADGYAIVDGSISKIVNRIKQSEDDFIIRPVVDTSEIDKIEDTIYTLEWDARGNLVPYGYHNTSGMGGKWLTVDKETYKAVSDLYNRGSGRKDNITAGQQAALDIIEKIANKGTIYDVSDKDVKDNIGRGEFSNVDKVINYNYTQNITSPTPANAAENARLAHNTMGKLIASSNFKIHEGSQLA